MSLDEKIVKAIEGYDKHYPDYALNKIKLAFADEGYVQVIGKPHGIKHVRIDK